MRRFHGLALAVSLAACSDTVSSPDVWKVWLTTDALIPSLVDHGRLELVDDAGNPLVCPTCRIDLELATVGADWPHVLTMNPVPGIAQPHLRTRLFRAGPDGEPQAATTIERIAVMPATLGPTDVDVAVYSDCIGLASDFATHQTCNGPARALAAEPALIPGRGLPSVLPGSWARGRTRPCAAGAKPAGMLCLSGGLFVFGDPSTTADVGPERYVGLSPIFLDVNEVTVGVVRALIHDGKVAGAPVVRGADPAARESACTYLGADDPTNDALPVNCVTHDLAAAVCNVLERRLPTEAEWQWASGNLQRETVYPWGDGRDPCDVAAVGRGRDAFSADESAACRAKPGLEAPGLPPAPSTTDVTAAGIVALGGGLAEWLSDSEGRHDAACWSPDEPFLADPQCSATPTFVVGGSGWASAPELASGLRRSARAGNDPSPAVGFRCALYAPEAAAPPPDPNGSQGDPSTVFTPP